MVILYFYAISAIESFRMNALSHSQATELPTLRDFLSLPKDIRMAETNRLMITSTIKMTLVRIRREPRIGSKAIIWKDNKTL